VGRRGSLAGFGICLCCDDTATIRHPVRRELIDAYLG
jgi:hypothetical protein